MQLKLVPTLRGLAAAFVLAACASDREAPTSASVISPSLTVASSGTVIVQPTSTAGTFTRGWVHYGDRLAAVGTATLVSGPATPPRGVGSLQLSNSAFGYEAIGIGEPAFAPGTLLGAVTTLSYATYAPSAQPAITVQHVSMQFTIDYDVNDAYEGFQGRLVYEPYHCNITQQDAWETWNTLVASGSGCWWQTANPIGSSAPRVMDVPQAVALPCPQANPCTWAEVVAKYPTAGFHRTNAAKGLILKVGSTWTGTFYADAIVAGAGSAATTYDFEPDGVPPAISNVTVTPNPAPVGTSSFVLSANATDNTAVTSASYTIEGGVPVPFTVVQGQNVSLSATLSTALAVGVYDICVTAKDAAGNFSNTECTMLAVYDPTAGFVTGGGWFTSPAGAYLADPLLTGRANFGFVSKYEKGRTLPTGNTEFQFTAAGLSFSSTAYEWLVVNQGGTNAQFKGTGTLNGVAGHEFMVWAKDGAPDSFRIKISNSAGIVVYDNSQAGEFGSTLGGGNIVIHTPKR